MFLVVRLQENQETLALCREVVKFLEPFFPDISPLEGGLDLPGVVSIDSKVDSGWVELSISGERVKILRPKKLRKLLGLMIQIGQLPYDRDIDLINLLGLWRPDESYNYLSTSFGPPQKEGSGEPTFAEIFWEELEKGAK